MMKPKPKMIAGEDTGPIKKAKFGRYATLQHPYKDMAAGDTIVLKKNTPTKDGYIQGGDYKVQQVGKNKYKIK